MSDYDRLEFRHLKFILAVAETQSFTGAAELVHTSQSNVSTQIGDLEDLLGVELFHRERDGVFPTPYGEVLIACARDLLQVREDVVEMLQALRTGDVTPLKLGYSNLVEKETLSDLISTTRRLFPHCEILAESDDISDLEQRVGTGELDGALVTLPVEHNSDLTTCIVDSEKLCVCMRSDDSLAQHEAIPAHTRLIPVEGGCRCPAVFVSAFPPEQPPRYASSRTCPVRTMIPASFTDALRWLSHRHDV